MKKAIKWKALLLITVALLLSACQATPENPHVQAKNDAFLKQSATTAEKNTESTVKGEAWTGSFACKAYPIHTRVNVKMQLPDKTFSIYSISPQKITQQQIDRFLSQFGDVEYHLNDLLKTRKDYQKEILALQQELSDPDFAQMTGEDAEIVRKTYEEAITRLQKFMAEAPETVDDVVEPVLTDKYFILGALEGEIMINGAGEIENGPNTGDSRENSYARLKEKNYRAIDVKWESSRGTNTLYVFDSDDGMPGTTFEYHAGRKGKSVSSLSLFPNTEDLREVAWSYEGALEMAQEQLKLLGLDYMTLAHSAMGAQAKTIDSTTDYTPKQYIFWFTRGVDGTPLTYTANMPAYDRFDEPWNDEELCITVDEGGVESITVRTLTKLGEKISGPVELLPLREIRHIAAEQFAMGNIALPPDIQVGHFEKLELNIQEAELGYARIKLGDGSGRYVLVPVWDFFGEYTVTDPDRQSGLRTSYGSYNEQEYRHSYLTVNAVDGTIIDRSLGY